jgi:hypothetical protein
VKGADRWAPESALVVSGGGSTVVATDEMLARAAALRVLNSEARDWRNRLERIRDLERVPAPAWTSRGVGAHVFSLACAVDSVERRSDELASRLVAAAEGYGDADRRAQVLSGISGASFTWLLGRLAPILLSAAVPALTGATVGWLLASFTAAQPGDTSEGLSELVRENPRLLTNPAVVQLVRVLLSGVDDGAAGVLGVPLPLSIALGDEGAGLLGVTSSAVGLLSLARPLGLLRETPVTVTPAGGPVPTRPPNGLADLARRIPTVSTRGPQVRIERYGGALKPSWILYIGGTASWKPVPGGQPWDVTSNVTAVAEQASGSYRSVIAALRQAGVKPDDPVIPVGHSQGGLIATQVAASGSFNIAALATFGTPAAHVHVPDTTPSIQTQHTDDLVTALGGTADDPESTGAAHLIVSREVFATESVPSGETLPAHDLDRYRRTAELIDASPEPRLQGFRERLVSIVGPEPGEATLWRGWRTDAAEAR